MRKPALQSHLFVVPNSGFQAPDSPETSPKPTPQRFVQVPFDLDPLPDKVGVEDV